MNILPILKSSDIYCVEIITNLNGVRRHVIPANNIAFTGVVFMSFCSDWAHLKYISYPANPIICHRYLQVQKYREVVY